MNQNEGLLADLSKAGFDRRQAVGLLLAGGTLLAGCNRGPSSGSAQAKTVAPDGSACIAWSQETNGPFPADGTNTADGSISNALKASDIVRTDIRNDLGTGGKRALGVPITVELKLTDMKRGCAPLASHAVYIWHCDASGAYSLYDKPERSYLRGLQVADAMGLVRFQTIVPGCYGGRYPHIHIEVFRTQSSARTGDDAILTSQIAVPADICRAAYRADPAYANSSGNFSNNDVLAEDFIFSDGGAEQMAAMTLRCTGSAANGFRGTTVVGV
jgi:protocatechuate 3,4-dioxygenase beta subunit